MLKNNKIRTISVLVYFLSIASYANNIDSDSLSFILNKFNSPKEKIFFLNKTTPTFYTDTSYSFLCLNKAIIIGEQNKLNSSLGDTYRQLGNIYNYHSIGYKTKECYITAYEYYTLANDSVGLAKITNNLGIYYYKWVNNYSKAELYLEKSLDLKLKLNINIESIGSTYYNLGLVHLYKDDYVESLKYLLLTLEIFEKKNSSKKIADIQNRIAQVYLKLDDIDRAKKHLKISRLISVKYNNKVELADNHLIFAKMYFDANKIDSALFELKSAEIIYKNENYLLGLGRVYNSYVNIFIEQKKFDKVFVYTSLAEDVFTKTGSIYDLALTYNRLGAAYFKTGKLKEGRDYFNKSQLICNKYRFLDLTVKNYLYLAEIEYKFKKYKNAYSYFVVYTDLRDSLYSINKSKIASEIEDKYIVHKKEIELQLLTKEKQKVEIERDKNKATSNYLMLIIILVLIVLSLLYYLYYSNKQLNDTLENLVDERTKELKKANRLLTNSKKNEEDVSRIKSDLLKNISESLKVPISEIQSLLKILKSENEDNDELYEQLELITSSTNRLNSVIKSVTELYFLEENRISVNTEFELDKLVVKISEKYIATALNRDINIKVYDSVSPIFFNRDIELISNAFDHLLKTVVDYANKGKIQISIKQDENYSTIDICSSNFNINKKVFKNDLSTNINSSANQIDRMFVNLYVTKKMINKMGGCIHWESSNNGEGIKFEIKFPNEEK